MQLTILIAILAYLIGSISPLYFIRNREIEGAAFVFTSIFDVLKGAFPLVIALYFSIPHYVYYLIALCTVLGHCFPFYVGFRGGKGFAPAVGALLCLWTLQGIFQFFTTALLGMITLIVMIFYLVLMFFLTKHYTRKMMGLEIKQQDLNKRQQRLKELEQRLQKHEEKAVAENRTRSSASTGLNTNRYTTTAKTKKKKEDHL